MAVITKYVIVRNGVELDKVFEDKKLAEAYDKMLDAAEQLAAFIKKGDLEIDLSEETIDAVAVYLAKNGPEVSSILKGVKPLKPASSATGRSEAPVDQSKTADDKKASRKAGAKPKDK